MKRIPNLNADIVIAKGAAGFEIGENFKDVISSICTYSTWSPGSSISLEIAIHNCSGWLLALGLTNDQEKRFLSYKGIVDLKFNSSGVLYEISVAKGYAGSLWGRVGIGMNFFLLKNEFLTIYDEGDEMYYLESKEGNVIPGIAFYVDDYSLNGESSQLISIISIHNWELAS